MRYKLERTLARLATSPYATKFVLKGGLLLAAYATERPTRDIDGLLRDLDVNEDTIRAVCQSLATQAAVDGLIYDIATLKVTEIREDSTYTGLRATMVCYLYRDEQLVAFDFSAGDHVAPPPETITIPGLLDDDVQLLGYPLTMSIAEKYVTALQRGEANTRWRDFTDISLISSLLSINALDLHTSLLTVAENRSATLEPLTSRINIPRYAAAAQPKYAAWRRKHKLTHLAAESFLDVLTAITRHVDPIAATQPPPRITWNPNNATWEPH
ncbi:MAG: nucleotidyl transferase AbiEii/AbiGii toxin family protein [Promicromonosporaceae bacterium]|nr:nucleotidyl transferase AbiEii/AbiGii toxin family protein [Promicromonosporaceae bacterium]